MNYFPIYLFNLLYYFKLKLKEILFSIGKVISLPGGRELKKKNFLFGLITIKSYLVRFKEIISLSFGFVTISFINFNRDCNPVFNASHDMFIRTVVKGAKSAVKRKTPTGCPLSVIQPKAGLNSSGNSLNLAEPNNNLTSTFNFNDKGFSHSVINVNEAISNFDKHEKLVLAKKLCEESGFSVTGGIGSKGAFFFEKDVLEELDANSSNLIGETFDVKVKAINHTISTFTDEAVNNIVLPKVETITFDPTLINFSDRTAGDHLNLYLNKLDSSIYSKAADLTFNGFTGLGLYLGYLGFKSIVISPDTIINTETIQFFLDSPPNLFF